ncbi:MAG: CYTH domain-containing protein [Bacteroidetes bacterium]|nr:CYTH domain-containing protein [Bacteroidota bacterium]MBU1720674.1 CYTH domain-containing protein [Bacteroidota bacterium]
MKTPPIEIERKWLIEKLPEGLVLPPANVIRQSYLAIDPAGTVVRVRQKNDKYFLTMKGAGLLSRHEAEMELQKADFEQFMTLSNGRDVEKNRYCLPFGEYTIELDIFSGKLSGLMLAEVEFKDIATAKQFSPPVWFGKEVTTFPEYTNAAMAVRGLP